MPAIHGWCLGLLCGLVPASDPQPAFVEEVWEAVQSESAHIGYLHTTVGELKGGKLLRTTAEMRLTFRRNSALLAVREEQGNDETPAGAIVYVFLRQYQGARKQVDLRGTLDEDRMHVVIDNGSSHIDRRLRWSDEVVGLAKRMHWYEEKKPRAGDHLTMHVYNPTYNTVVTLRGIVGEAEEVPVLGKRQKLVRVDWKPDPIVTADQKIPLPASVVWLDENFVPVRRQVTLDGVGEILLSRTTRTRAQAGGGVTAPDINKQAMIPLNRTIANPHGTRSVVYRITVKDDPEPGKVLVQDDHQEIRNLKGNTFELHVHPVGPGGHSKLAAAAEYLAPNPYIPSDDAKIIAMAERAAGTETDPWKKAQAIERWVHDRMRVDNVAPLVNARKVAETMAGDCRHYALLTTALCRAQGIPARTAIGLIYVKGRQTPNASLGFHMWTEAWIDGRWLGLDATLGLGHIGAGHIKITQNSWYSTRSLTPLLPVTRVLGKLSVEVVQVEGK